MSEKKYVEKIKDISSKSRENYAKQLLDINKLTAEILAVAEKGFQDYRVKPTCAIDIQFTKAAAKAEESLKKMGFNIKWVRAFYPPEYETQGGNVAKKVNHSNTELNVNEMLIMWYSKSKMMNISTSISAAEDS